jgi:toxin CcdB
MALFTIYRNKNARTKTTFPFLVDVQSDLLEDLQTRVVIPLSKAAALTSNIAARTRPPLVSLGAGSPVVLTGTRDSCPAMRI